MPDVTPDAPPARRIVVIGAGAAGLTAAWRLGEVAEVTVLETEGRLGGHGAKHHPGAVEPSALLVEPIKHKTSPQPVFPGQNHGRLARGGDGDVGWKE